MNEQEICQLINDFKGYFKKKFPKKSKEEIEHLILDVFFETYIEGEMDRKDLTTLTKALGYEVDDEILDQIDKDKKNKKK